VQPAPDLVRGVRRPLPLCPDDHRAGGGDADDPGEPVARMVVRALMVPPGIPDFATRRRFASASPQTIEGRAWSGRGAITAVEVSLCAQA